MNKAFALLFCCYTVFCYGQTTENQQLIEMGKAYKDYMFINNPAKEFVKGLQADITGNLKPVASFISQTISKDNDLLKQAYLTLPDSQTLKFIFIVCSISENIRHENQVDNNKLIDSLNSAAIPKNELVGNYYSMLFTSAGNKIQPFNLSKVDFILKDYNLSNDTEKGIFFLECMRYCGSEIWGYMHIVRPPNTKKAYDYIKKFPKFNGGKYYQFTDLNFPDFKMVIEEDKAAESYKGYYINKYYDLLLSHLACLQNEGATDKDINELLLGSILKDNELYKYSSEQELLENLFKEQK